MEQQSPSSLYFDDLPEGKVLEFNPVYVGLEGAPRVREQFRHLHTDINGNPPLPMGYGGKGREFILSVINFSEKQISTALSVCPALAGLRWLVPGGPPQAATPLKKIPKVDEGEYSMLERRAA